MKLFRPGRRALLVVGASLLLAACGSATHKATDATRRTEQPHISTKSRSRSVPPKALTAWDQVKIEPIPLREPSWSFFDSIAGTAFAGGTCTPNTTTNSSSGISICLKGHYTIGFFIKMDISTYNIYKKGKSAGHVWVTLRAVPVASNSNDLCPIFPSPQSSYSVQPPNSFRSVSVTVTSKTGKSLSFKTPAIPPGVLTSGDYGGSAVPVTEVQVPYEPGESLAATFSGVDNLTNLIGGQELAGFKDVPTTFEPTEVHLLPIPKSLMYVEGESVVPSQACHDVTAMKTALQNQG